MTAWATLSLMTPALCQTASILEIRRRAMSVIRLATNPGQTFLRPVSKIPVETP
ncbi:MAG: hypothetical protein H0T97_08105 [Actinobacteria bacterium]|nr:hypothetical protein [Actinomycetota bacterium]